jgi:type I restriction enzyme S subunit
LIRGDIPFIKVSDMTLSQNQLHITAANNWVSHETIKRLKLKPAPPSSIVFAKIGEGLKAERLRLITRPTVIDNNMMAAIPNEDVDATFLFYLLHNLHLAHYAEGSALPYLRASDLSQLFVQLPPLQEQRLIAETLEVLDVKIESNRKVIELFQNLSRAMYGAWRETLTELHSSTFGEFAEVFGGSTPKTSVSEYWDGGIAWTTPTDITALSAPYLFSTARTISDSGLASSSATLHPAGTIFMTSRATIGSFAVNQIPAATNQGFIAVRPRHSIHRWFLFEEMRSRVAEMLDRANGSTFMELSRGNFKSMVIEVPVEDKLAELDATLSPIHAKAAQLVRESSRLSSLRDALLPELISGRVRISDHQEVVQGFV